MPSKSIILSHSTLSTVSLPIDYTDNSLRYSKGWRNGCTASIILKTSFLYLDDMFCNLFLSSDQMPDGKNLN